MTLIRSYDKNIHKYYRGKDYGKILERPKRFSNGSN